MMLDTNKVTCDCGSNDAVNMNYKPVGSENKTRLYFCNDCNSILSKQQTNIIRSRKQRISCDANWGNIRHGKGARLKKNVSFFKDVIPKSYFSNVLDIGSNRGHFINWLINNHDPANIHAIESDVIIYKETPLPTYVKYINNRFENYEYEHNKFSFIYNSHTLEHLENPYTMLKKCHRILMDNGYMFLEVPNTEIIEDKDNLEEYFIDKHNYHFFLNGLKLKLNQIGFDIIKESLNNKYNISFVVKKNKNIIKDLRKSKNNIQEHLKSIKNYEISLKENRKKLKEICKKINNLCSRQKVVIWGCSRILDAALKYGALEKSNIQFIIDNNISNILSEINGLKVFNSSILHEKDIDVVIIMARSSKNEIIESARSFGIRHVFTMDQF